MKKMIYISLVLAMCFFVSSCGKSNAAIKDNFSTNYEDVQDMSNNFTLIINGKNISSDKDLSINHEKQYAEIPLIATLRALGCQVEWVNAKRVEIIYNDTVYILNPKKKTLKKKGDSFNIIAIAPGATHGVYCETVDQEFIIDSDSISYFLYLLGAQIAIDYDQDTVIIDWKTKEVENKTGDGSVS